MLQSASAGVLAAACWLGIGVAAAAVAPDSRLDFEITEGRNTNRFLREGDVAAHLVLRSGQDPRILMAFPAGNSGVGLWFAHHQQSAHWTLRGAPAPAHATDGKGRLLNGMTVQATLTGADLEVREAVLSSVRVLRDYEALGKLPGELSARASVSGRTLTWARDRLDGAAGYRLVLEVTSGELRDGRIRPAADGAIGLRITGLTGETPLTPLFGSELLDDAAAADPAARNTLTFLAYRQKLLAGSWRFDTYFGRDTLISVRLLLPVLSPAAVEAGLSSVLARLSPQGEVAHEEDIGERAVLDHMAADGSRSAAPVFDYKMIDADYLLGPVSAAWLLHDPRGRARATAFLAGPAGGAGERPGTRGAALVDNLRFVLKSAAGFAEDPGVARLIALKPGFAVGDWRDSETGLGGGRYPYDVNAVLVPAALAAAAQLNDSGLLKRYLNAADQELLARASKMARTWHGSAPPLFEVHVAHQQAASAISAYASGQRLPADRALAALGSGAVSFHAVSLDATGAPVPVMNSDEGFALLFGELAAEDLDAIVTVLPRPFPAGLMTDVGMLVANAAFCAPELQKTFSRNAYHGAVIWSWQEALFAAGLARQLERQDLPAPVRERLRSAQETLWSAIEATRVVNTSELWSWSFSEGRYQVAPFGADAADADESNAAQLWSTVYLAVRPPRPP
ncbi:MAG TPA: hypothetical protein VH109_09825 [Steroidobacteraceae bacterium]|nr:hypothetical protein [Steroidobacteraceae bacterium]